MTKKAWIALCAAAVAAWSGAAQAHTAAGRSLDGGAVIVEFRYSDNQPMAYAATKVIAPGETSAWQVGRTDGSGRFAFVPDRAGAWQVEALDEENHAARYTVNVAQNLKPAPALSPFWGLVLWGSVILNLFLIGHLIQRRSATRQI